MTILQKSENRKVTIYFIPYSCSPTNGCVIINHTAWPFIIGWYPVIDILLVTASISKLLYSYIAVYWCIWTSLYNKLKFFFNFFIEPPQLSLGNIYNYRCLFLHFDVCVWGWGGGGGGQNHVPMSAEVTPLEEEQSPGSVIRSRTLNREVPGSNLSAWQEQNNYSAYPGQGTLFSLSSPLERT